MDAVLEKLDQITQNTQWTEEILLSIPRKTEQQQAVLDGALKNLANWLKTDMHEVRKAFE